MDQALSSSSSASSHPQQQAEDLLSQLQRLQGGSTAPLPSARQMFSIGSLLHHSRKHVAEDTDMLLAYQHLVDVLPESHWKYLLETLQQAAHRLAAASLPHLMAAVQALNGLLTNAPRLCQLAYYTNTSNNSNNSSGRDGWVSTLAALYDRIVVLTTTTSASEDKEDSLSCRDTLLATLSSLLLDGLFLLHSTTTTTGNLLEEEILEAIQAMEEQSTDCLADLQEWQSSKEPFRRTLESQVRKSLVEQNNDEQQAYILKMLASARETKNASPLFSPPMKPTQQAAAAPSKKKTSSSTTTVVSPSDELERRIHQVQQILPDFGQGFLEAALSLHQGSVEATVATLLLPAEYPTALRALDTKLPRRHKERSAEEVVEASQARQLTKERLALEAKEEEARYQALVYMADKEQQQQQQNVVQHSEYDDDYDDQYDELDVKLGGADDGQYDFEQVKLYNQLVRTEEKEDSFWQDNLNTNRISTQASKKSNNKQEDAERATKEKNWGPDKIKGGRVVGPDGKIIRKPGGQRGKKGGRGNGSAGGAKPSAPPSKEGSTQPPVKNGSATNGGPNAVANKGKPRTKPKSQNRVNRQRDKKQKAQGTFGNSV